jgi:hypothetical protein
VSAPLIREVFPVEHETEALDRVLAKLDRRRRATVLAVWCGSNHGLGQVIRVGAELAYVARVDHSVLGVVEIGRGGPTVTPQLASERFRRTEYVEFLSPIEDMIAAGRGADAPPIDPDSVPAHLFALPAECECRPAPIGRKWIDDALSAGKKNVIWTEVRR